MQISDRLDHLCTQLAGCRTAAFGDLGTRLVYRVAGQDRCGQEVLDAATEAAAEAFALGAGLPGEAGTDSVIVLTPRDVRIAVRSAAGAEEQDFILCLCDTAADHAAIAAAAQQALSATQQEQAA